MNRQLAQHAQALMKTLGQDLRRATVACPLCGAVVPSRGVRLRLSQRGERWELIFTCPSCGLVTAFNAQTLTLKQLQALHGSSWAAELRKYKPAVEDLLARQKPTLSHFMGVVVINMLTWIALTGSLLPFDLAWGAVVSLVVARFSYRYVRFDLPRWVLSPRRWLYFADLLLEFARQLVAQNVSLTVRVLRPDMHLKPGIVAVPVKLRDEVSLTILAALMSLTPDTVTLDIDAKQGIMYVHWIDVKTTDPQEAYALIAASLEDKIIRWLH